MDTRLKEISKYYQITFWGTVAALLVYFITIDWANCSNRWIGLEVEIE